MERDSKQSFAAAGVFILLVMGIVFSHSRLGKQLEMPCSRSRKDPVW